MQPYIVYTCFDVIVIPKYFWGLIHNMKLLFLFFNLLLFAGHACCQYYYSDIILLKETNRQYQAIKNARITGITARNFDADGQSTEGFIIRQEVGANSTEITTVTDIPATGETVSVNYYSDNRLARTVDNDSNIINTVTYAYNADGNVLNITTDITDTFMNSHSREIHEWFYEGTTPVRMLKIKDYTDTTVVEFVKDEQGNIAEEHWKKKGRSIENYFYYYNDAHLVTDLVRFNTRARKMLPDFLFEYDAAGRVSQFTQIQQNTGGYLVWHYEYNANALKQTETCYDKQKQFVGKIEYKYR